ncbi:MAG: PAS domain S-box protein [Rhodocyclaceae bacterium]|nr:PAS domain S-box protein [Rhodocyclaceae bacterium]
MPTDAAARTLLRSLWVFLSGAVMLTGSILAGWAAVAANMGILPDGRRIAVFALAATALVVVAGFLLYRRTGLRLDESGAAREATTAADRIARQRLEAALDVAPEAVLVLDVAADAYVYANASAAELYGIGRDEFGALRPGGLSPERQPDGRDSRLAMADLMGRAAAGEAVQSEWTCQRPDGRQIPCEIRLVPLPEAGRSLVRASIIDVSRRKEDERRLRLSEEKFARFFHASPDYMTLSRLDDGLILDVNEGFVELSGWSREEAVGRTALDLGVWADPEDRRNFAETIRRDGRIKNHETRLRRRNGELRHCLISASVVRVGDEALLVGIVRDISERIAAEEALRLSEEKFSRVFHGSPDYITISRLEDGRILDANESFEQIIGWPRAEAIGRTAVELGIWADPEQRAVLVDLLRRDGRVANFEIRVRRRDGEIRSGLVSASMVRVGDEPLMVAILRDITERMAAADALRLSEEKLSLVFMNSPDSITLTRLADGRFSDVSRSFEEIAGWPREESIGRSSVDMGIWKHPEQRQELARRLKEEGVVRDFEWTFVRKDGEERIGLSSAVVVTIAGEPYLVLFVRDVTRRKQEELALRLSEEKFSKLFDLNPDHIAIADLETGCVLDVNRAFEQGTGWSREEVVGRQTVQLGLWNDPAARNRAVSGVMQDGHVSDMPFEMRRRDGEIRRCLLSAFLVKVGERTLFFTVVRDITERLRAEDALRLSEEKFSRIFHYSPDYIVLTRLADGRIFDVNEGFEETSGWTREEALGRTSLEMNLWVTPEERDYFVDVMRREGRIRNMEARYRRKDGEIGTGLLSASSIVVSGEQCLVTIVRDITDRKRAEAALQALAEDLEQRVARRTEDLSRSNRQLSETLETLRHAQDELVRSEKLASLGTLVAGVAHELNTPLGNSLMVATTLAEKHADFGRLADSGQLRRSVLATYVGQADEALRMLIRNLHQASELIGHFKRLAVDQTSTQRRAFDLREIVDDVLLSVGPQFRKTSHRVENLVPAALAFDSYPGPLGQILTNLLSNALLHGFEGLKSRSVTVGARSTDNDRVVISVADDGRGIPADIQGRIFDPFFTTRMGRGGSGLGLHIVYTLVTRVLGGRIAFESQAGKGTTFHITLPQTAPESQKDATP